MIQLLDWSIVKSKLHGYALNHPDIGIGNWVTSTYVSKLEEFEDHFIITTRSGSQYMLELNKINADFLPTATECFKALDAPESAIEKLKSIKLYEPTDVLITEDYLYIEVAEGYTIYAFTKSKDKFVRAGKKIHIGTSIDSTLISTNKIDFRYFNNWDTLQIYTWNGFEHLVVRNIGSTPIEISGDTKEIVSVLPGNTATFSKNSIINDDPMKNKELDKDEN